jgi:NAD-dependent deacetylase
LVHANYYIFRRDPTKYWTLAKEFHTTIHNAKPNPAHFALVELEKMGKLKAIITQNIDDLHQKAGSKKVLELHGTYKTATCLKCHAKFAYEDGVEKLERGEMPPTCSCGGVIKTDLIFFGEELKPRVFNEVFTWARKADLTMVIGAPMDELLSRTLFNVMREDGGKSILINLQDISGLKFDFKFIGKIEKILPKIVEEVKRRKE